MSRQSPMPEVPLSYLSSLWSQFQSLGLPNDVTCFPLPNLVLLTPNAMWIIFVYDLLWGFDQRYLSKPIHIRWRSIEIQEPSTKHIFSKRKTWVVIVGVWDLSVGAFAVDHDWYFPSTYLFISSRSLSILMNSLSFFCF